MFEFIYLFDKDFQILKTIKTPN